MTPISFIITTYNIEAYVDGCLATVGEAARPGDEVIVVDDGSTDRTPEMVRAFAAAAPAGVEVRPILLGLNTPGGVGVAGNIGLQQATRDVVFFVDGDDWLEIDGFNACRQEFEGHDVDAMLCGYREYDELKRTFKMPADAARWQRAPRAEDPRARRMLALDMIAVPWRKFYRRDFLRANKIRFPEGDHFFEDNPFHWEVCLKARDLSFKERVLCVHRMNRPGQTMASTGAELMAFFTHFDTILGMLPEGDAELHALAGVWIIHQISWHSLRLDPSVHNRYARRAAQALARLEDGVWRDTLQPRFAETRLGPALDAMRAGLPQDAAAIWTGEAATRRIDALNARITELAQRLDGVAKGLDGLREIERRKAIDALTGSS